MRGSKARKLKWLFFGTRWSLVPCLRGQALWFRVQGRLMEEADKDLKEAILELAQEHSRATDRQVRERLNRPAQSIPKELEEWLALVVTQAKNMPPPPPGQTPAR